MNLIDIVKQLPWPDGAAVVVQDCTVNGTGLLKYCYTDLVEQLKYIDEQRSKFWVTNECPVRWAASELADDHDEAIVTHADWLEATMNTETQIPMPEMVSIPKQDLEALLAELEHYRKRQDGRADA